MARLRCKHCSMEMTNAWEEDLCLKKPKPTTTTELLSSLWEAKERQEAEKPSPFLQFLKPASLTPLGQVYSVLAEVALERTRQDTKWGVNRPNDGQMMLILAEEVGEAARAAQEEYVDRLREELIQVAAVAVKWIETLDWRTKRG